jgi:hypothetical protein
MTGPVAQPLTDEDAESLLAWLSSGQTLNDWIRGPGANYSRRLVYYRIAADPLLSEAFKISRQVGSEMIADNMREKMHAEPERVTDQNGVTRIDPGYVALIKARADIDLRLLAKWHSGKYGDKVTNELVGADGGPVKIEGITVKLVRPDAG